MGKTLRSLTTFACIAALASCTGDDPAADAEADLLLRLEVGAAGVDRVQVDSVWAPGAAPELVPGDRGALRVHWVDADEGRVLASGRIPLDRFVMAEEFDALNGIRGEAIDVVADTRQVLLPRPPGGRGRLTLAWTDETGADRVSAWTIHVPREGALPIAAAEVEPVDDLSAPLRAPDRSAPTAGVAGARAALHGSEHCGNGELEEDLYYIGGYVGYVGEHCDDGNTEDGDGCSSDCRHELVHVGGAPAESSSITVVYVPAGWGDLEAFEAYARFQSEGTLASDFYDAHADEISFWALSVPEVDELGSVGCGDVGGVNSRIADLRDAIMGGRYDGALRAHRPLQATLSTPSECRSWAQYGGNIMLGVDPRDTVMAHEMGHSLGHLADEYPYGDRCQGEDRPNISYGTPVKWACLAEARSDARCPDGQGVHMRGVGGACAADVITPCSGCMMFTAADDFCPVCEAQLEAVFASLLGSGLDESCNGADDDLNGTTDDGCDCATCTPVCGGRECGGDGCFGDCGACGLGEGCRDYTCATGCEQSCRTATGSDVCLGEPGLFHCSPGEVTRCTCASNSSGGLALTDCSACIPIGCMDCTAGEACDGSSCVSDCPPGTTSCDGRCVDLANDSRHCGACGATCAPAESCNGGACTGCPAGQIGCSDGCVDPSSDPANCGTCGRTCSTWQQCNDGVCSACPAGTTNCDGTCVDDLATDSEHCGRCGNACADGQFCRRGTCVMI